MRLAVAFVVLTGCDYFFLTENIRPPDASIDAPLRCPDVYMGQRYVLVRTDLKWSEAEKTCRAQTGGTDQSHLAVIGSRAEFETIGTLIGASSFHVGLSNRRGGLFQWITTEVVAEPIPWATNQPDGSELVPYCGVVYDDGVHDAPCDMADDFICECDGYTVDLDRI